MASFLGYFGGIMVFIGALALIAAPSWLREFKGLPEKPSLGDGEAGPGGMASR